MNKNLFKYRLYSLIGKNAKAEKYKSRIRFSYKELLNFFSKKKDLKLTNIEKLSQSPFPFLTKELFYFTDFYGINYILKKYMELPQTYQFKCVIQHGVSYYPQTIDQEFHQNLPILLTTSRYSKKILSDRAPQYEFIPISLNILYADYLFSQKQFLSLKENLGKNLLFFPYHSAVWSDVISDTNFLITILLDIKRQLHIDTITICLYWLDIQLGMHKAFLDKGFHIVTAGHILDPFFLPRLKSILSLANIVVSNAPGSHLFYALGLNKPCYLVKDSTMKANVKEKYDAEDYQDDWLSKMFNRPETEELFNVFDTPSFQLTNEQIKLKERYCDLESFKTPKELKKIIDYSEELYQHGNYKEAPLPSEIYI